MFERFTETARGVVVEAQSEARGLMHDYIGTEHLLLGLFAEGEGIAAKVLRWQGITARAAREQIVNVVGAGDGASPGQIPFTPRAKKVLELSLREALQLGQNWINSGHLLLGLLDEPEGLGARILIDLGTDPDAIREAVRTWRADHEPHPRRSGEAAQPGSAPPLGWFGSSFSVVPDPDLKLLLRSAAGRALGAGRTEYGLDDLRAAMRKLEDDASSAREG